MTTITTVTSATVCPRVLFLPLLLILFLLLLAIEYVQLLLLLQRSGTS